ncbi:MAG: redoxin domain-containing protein [Anaerolineales bacterium]|nr:redoxin domain-containing protein [Anaerolineales bacterium]
MAQLRQHYQKFIGRDTEVLVIGPEGSRQFKSYWQDHDLPFIGMPNPDHSVLKLFGQQVNLFKLGRMPAQVIVDKGGVARYVHYGKSMSDIPENQELLDLLDELNAEFEATESHGVSAENLAQ